MYLCYIDESGTSAIPGNTSHFVLAGVSLPIWHWRDADSEITQVLAKFGLENEEFHTAWILRNYLEQSMIPGFDGFDRTRRRSEVERYRNTQLLDLQRANKRKAYKQARKNYRHTAAYTHLTLSERRILVMEVARVVSGWGFARLFAECIDKIYFDPAITRRSIDEQAFEQIVSRFETYLQKVSGDTKSHGLLVHDNNHTVAKKHTEQMRQFHQNGTLWTHVENTIETPLFVDSSLTRMVQVDDLCSYAIRRYLENDENELFDLVFQSCGPLSKHRSRRTPLLGQRLRLQDLRGTY